MGTPKESGRKRRWSQIVSGNPAPAQWPAPSESQIPPDRLEEYNNLHVAATAYAEGKDPAEIKKLSKGVSLDRARGLYERCVTLNPRTGQIYGYYACIPGRRIRLRPRQRRKPIDPTLAAQGRGLVLSLRDLFTRYPAIEADLRIFVLTRSLCGARPVPEVTPPIARAAFIRLCVQHGVPSTQWPFIDGGRGLQAEKAISDWFEELRVEHPVEVARSQFGDEAAAKVQVDLNASNSKRLKPPAKRAYEEVQLDGHRVDALFSILYPSTGGEWAVVTHIRLWLIALIEVVTGTALASTVAYGDAIRADDIYRLFRRALWAPKRYDLSLNDPDYKYLDGAMYPAELEKDLGALSFGMVRWDRASMHISVENERRLERVLGCEFTHGRVAHPMEQSIAENFNGFVAPYMHMLPTSTGSDPKDVARRNPEVMANLLKMPAALGGEILDVLIRNRNACVGKANIPRIQHLLELKNRGEIFESRLGGLAPPQGHLLLPEYPVEITRSRGATGAWVVNFDYGRYSSVELNKDPILARSTVRTGKLYPQENAQKAYLVADAVKDRVFELKLVGAFADVPHTTEWRRVATAERYRLKGQELVTHRRMFLAVTKALGERAANGDAAATTQLSSLVNGMADLEAGRTSPVEVPPALIKSSPESPPQALASKPESEVAALLDRAVRGTGADDAPDDEPVYLQAPGEPNMEGKGRQFPNGYKLPQPAGLPDTPAAPCAPADSATPPEEASAPPRRRLRVVGSPPIAMPQEPASGTDQAYHAASPPAQVPPTPRLSSDDPWDLGLNS